MKSKLSITALALGLAACARTEPIPEDALDDVAPPDPVAVEQDAADAAPELTPGMRWEIDEAANAALYGGDRASPALSVRCDEDDDNSLVLARFFPTVPSGAGTMTLSGNGAVASVPVSAEANEGRPGGRLTATLDAGTLSASVANVLRGAGAINVTVTGADPIILMGGPEVESILSACLGDEVPNAEPDAALEPVSEDAA